jgi:hypothetical protein
MRRKPTAQRGRVTARGKEAKKSARARRIPRKLSKTSAY